MLFCLMLSTSSRKMSLVLFLVSFFCCLGELQCCSPVCFEPLECIFQDNYNFYLALSYIFSLFHFLLSSYTLLPGSLGILLPLFECQVDGLSLFHLVLFLKLCLILLIKVYFSISLFCLVLCVCFYLLGKSATQNHPFLKDLAYLGGKEGFSMQSPRRQDQALQGRPQRCAVSSQRGGQCYSIRLGRGGPPDLLWGPAKAPGHAGLLAGHTHWLTD